MGLWIAGSTAGAQSPEASPFTEDPWPAIRAERIAINTGESPIADGLSHTQYRSMTDALNPKWVARMTSAEPLIMAWLAVKIPSELEIMRKAAEITARWEVEAYAAAIPGVTTAIAGGSWGMKLVMQGSLSSTRAFSSSWDVTRQTSILETHAHLPYVRRSHK